MASVLVLLVPAAGAEPPRSTHDPAEVRQLADDILARDEFQPPQRSVLESIGDWIGDHLVPGDSNGDGGGSGSTSGGPSAGGSGGSGILTTILFVVAVAALGYVAWLLVQQPRRRRRLTDEDPAAEVEAHRSAREWSDLAARYEAEGQWKDGLRCRFRALLERLVDGRVVPEVAGRTTGELRADVHTGLPAAGAEFDAAAELFDRAWYGDLPTGADEAGRFAGSAAVVLAELDRRERS